MFLYISGSSSIVCIGIMYESLGRLMGRTYDETVQILLKLLKNADVRMFTIFIICLFTYFYSCSRKLDLKFILH